MEERKIKCRGYSRLNFKGHGTIKSSIVQTDCWNTLVFKINSFLCLAVLQHIMEQQDIKNKKNSKSRKKRRQNNEEEDDEGEFMVR